MRNTIIYLIGHYGVGKLTVATAICAQTGARLFDNHLANNVIFSLVRKDGATPIPERVWELIMTIRRQALTAMAEIAHPDQSFILTNALMEDDPMDRQAYDEVVEVAARRRAMFVPVILTASDKAHAERVASHDREERMKLTDAEVAAAARARKTILRVDHPHRLDIETTHLAPDAAAAQIVAHARSLAL